MRRVIYLFRHAESVKNTIMSSSSTDGNEPLSQNGQSQLINIAYYFKKVRENLSYNNVNLITSPDKRCIETAKVIGEAMGISYSMNVDLQPCKDKRMAGRLLNDIYGEYSDFENELKLYRAGLLSAYDVKWPDEAIFCIEERTKKFIAEGLSSTSGISIIVSHKSVITGLVIQLMREKCQYPTNFYGYVDIPTGTGIKLVYDYGEMKLEKIDFTNIKVQKTSDIVMNNGMIRFPESSCAVCWDDNKLLLVQQKREEGQTWELPGGKMEQREQPEETAKRELYEEAGTNASQGNLLKVIDLDLSASYHRTYLVEFQKFKAWTTGEFKVKWWPLESLMEMLGDNKITHAPTIIAILMKKAVYEGTK